jgi:hypothetical protein
MVFKGIFTRISPHAFSTRAEFPAGWFAVSWRWIAECCHRRRGHGKWCKITSEHGSIYRVLRFSAELPGSPLAGTGEIVLDWDGWLYLHGRADDVDKPLELTVSAARWWAFPQFALAHPDPTIRLAGLLALLSVALGLLSIVLTVLPWFSHK